MKKLALALVITVLTLTGCGETIGDKYNVEVDRYNQLLEVDYVEKVNTFETIEEKETFYSNVTLLDMDIKELEEEILFDGKITEEELSSFQELIDEMEVMING